MRRLATAVLLGSALVVVTVTTATAGGRRLETTLQPASGSAASGTAEITLNQGLGEVCFDMTWTGTSAPITAAHIHVVSTNAIAVGLFGPPGTTPVTNSGCVSASPETVKAIRQDPDAYYVNLHSSAFPAGELAGVLGH